MLKRLQFRQQRWKISLSAFLVFSSGAAVYFGTLVNGFINFDDPFYVTENQHVLKGLTAESVKWAFTTFHAANWHPLTWLSHMLDVQIFGMNPTMHHLTSLIIHAVNCTLFFFFLARVTSATKRNIIAALLFALHPLHVESVAWVSERKDLLCGLFWLLGMHAYVHYTKRPSHWRYILLIITFACALLSKPMAVTFPLALLLIDFWPLRRIYNNPRPQHQKIIWLAIEKAPLLLLSAVSAIVTFLAQKSGGAVSPTIFQSIPEHSINAAAAIPRYLLKTFWPVNLSILYPFDPDLSWGLAGLVIISTVTVTAFNFRKNAPYFFFGWLWFLLTLLPVLGIIPYGLQSIADRYMYLPLISLCIAVTWGVTEASPKIFRSSSRWIISAMTLIVLVLTSLLTWKQSYYWRDSITLFSRTVMVTKPNWMAEHQLGTALSSSGMYPAALYHLSEAYRLNPSYIPTMFNMAIIYKKSGNNELALQMLQKAALLSPDDFDIRYSLFRLYINNGDAVSAKRELDVIAKKNPRLAVELAREWKIHQ